MRDIVLIAIGIISVAAISAAVLYVQIDKNGIFSENIGEPDGTITAIHDEQDSQSLIEIPANPDSPTIGEKPSSNSTSNNSIVNNISPSNIVEDESVSAPPSLDELRSYALEKINSDRRGDVACDPNTGRCSIRTVSGGTITNCTDPKEHSTCITLDESGNSDVRPSDNQAAQIHAKDVLETRRISHWMTNGEKPYMTYSRLGGIGDISQNVFVSRYDDVASCRAGIVLCDKIDPIKSIDSAEFAFMFEDAASGWGHRDNIVDKYHTHVSIGIAYDDYTFVLVQNFENNYLELNRPLEIKYHSLNLDATILSGNLEAFGVYYDPNPTTYEYNKHRDDPAYGMGNFIATVVPPVEPGSYYEKTQDYVLIQAKKWNDSGKDIIVSFDLSPAIDEPGTYTVLGWLKDSEGKDFSGFSYTLFVN